MVDGAGVSISGTYDHTVCRPVLLLKTAILAERKKERRAAEKERKKPAGEKDETRLKRLEEELKTGAAAQKARGTLIVEFSIENVQVVKRRQEKVSSHWGVGGRVLNY